MWACLAHPAVWPFVHFFIYFLLFLAIETFNGNDDYYFQVGQLSTNTIVGFIDVGVFSSPSNKTICSFFSTFPLIAGYWDLEFKWQYDLLVGHVSANIIFDCFDEGVTSSRNNKTICSFFSVFPLITDCCEFQWKCWYDYQVCEVIVNTTFVVFM